MPINIGPKTIASVIGLLLILGAILWAWLTIVHLREQVATQSQTILTQQAAVVEQAAKDNAAAAAALKAHDDVAAQTIADVQTRVEQNKAIISKITEGIINAPPADLICSANSSFPPAFSRSFDELFATDSGGRSTSGKADSGQRPSGAPGMPTVAQGNRTVVEIGPARGSSH